jgi:hypothetical protein
MGTPSHCCKAARSRPGFQCFTVRRPAMIGLLEKPLRPPMSVNHERQAKKSGTLIRSPGFFSKSN